MIGWFILIGVFIVIGIFLFNGKGSFLIAGYNMMSKEEKAEYDTIALCKFMGKMMFVFSFVLVLGLISDLYNLNWLVVLVIVLAIGLTIFTIAYMNTGNRFKK